MKKLTLILFAYPLISLAQEKTPFDFLSANAALKKFSKFDGTIGISQSAKKSCFAIQEYSGLTMMSCQLSDEDYDQSVITKVDFKSGQIPAGLEQILPLNVLEEVKNKKLSCLFRFKMENDNRQLLGCKGKVSLTGFTNQSERCGDDFGNTHLFAVGVSCSTEDGIQNIFTYSTNLFTNPIRSTLRRENGITHISQRFTSENVFSWIQNNINQGEVTYWKRDVGFINLSEKKKWNLMQSTGQQEWFHQIMNSHGQQAYDYTYVEGSKDKWGLFVALSIGLQENRKLGNKCKLQLSADIGARLSTLKDSNTLNFNAGGKFSFQLTDNGSIYLRSEIQAEKRPAISIINTTLAAGYERTSGSMAEVGVTKQTGNRRDVADLPNIYSTNKKNDLKVLLQVRYGF